MERGSLDLRFLFDGLDADGLDELRDAVASRLCREKYGADTIEGLLAKWGHEVRCPSCGARFSLLSGTIFANSKLALHKIMKIVEIMCCKVFSTLGGWQDCVMLSGRV